MTMQPREGPLGDTVPTADAPDDQTHRGQKPERIQDCPNVGSVKPEDYPALDWAKIDP